MTGADLLAFKVHFRWHAGPVARMGSAAVAGITGCLLAFTVLGSGTALAADVWSVEPGQDMAQALMRAADGDTVELMPGVHQGQVAVLQNRRLTLRGATGAGDQPRPVLLAAGRHAEGKGILVVRGGEVTVENIEFRGARVRDGNGAGIRFDHGRLTVRNSAFFDNENGILTGNVETSELLVEDSVFGAAPLTSKLPHLIYVGRIARFTLLGSHVSGGQLGHLVKSRARYSELRYNHLVDGAEGRAAYELEFPNGGEVVVVGNVIAQSPQSSNPTVVSFGVEGPVPATAEQAPRQHSLLMLSNTLFSEGWRPALFVRVFEDRLQAPVTRQLVNNLMIGLGIADLTAADLVRGNLLASASVLQDAAQGNFELPARSWVRGKGLAPDDPVAAADKTLMKFWPRAQFKPPLGRRPLPELQQWSPGAHP